MYTSLFKLKQLRVKKLEVDMWILRGEGNMLLKRAELSVSSQCSAASFPLVHCTLFTTFAVEAVSHMGLSFEDLQH